MGRGVRSGRRVRGCCEMSARTAGKGRAAEHVHSPHHRVFLLSGAPSLWTPSLGQKGSLLLCTGRLGLGPLLMWTVIRVTKRPPFQAGWSWMRSPAGQGEKMEGQLLLVDPGGGVPEQALGLLDSRTAPYTVVGAHMSGFFL